MVNPYQHLSAHDRLHLLAALRVDALRLQASLWALDEREEDYNENLHAAQVDVSDAIGRIDNVMTLLSRGEN